MIGKQILLVFVFLLCCCPAGACINDRDTLAEEVTGLPDVVQVITGRFPRNPPLFYEMRLARVTAELKANPMLLNDYDDAGAACDRLGRDDEAIAWMGQKREHLPPYNAADPNLKEQWYRYYANVGTFRVHRWIRAGADQGRIAEVVQARGEIAQAIAIKPDAHFGREKYQLQVMDWIIKPTSRYYDNTGATYPTIPLRQYLQENNNDYKEAIQGLSGLVVLGNAWESVDIYSALGQYLEPDQKMTLAYLASLRSQELAAEGHTSLNPNAASDQDLYVSIGDYELVGGHAQARHDYTMLRAEAEKWQKQRTAYMMARLQAGRHPDTDPTFWKDYHETAPPSLPEPWNRQIWLWLGRPSGYYPLFEHAVWFWSLVALLVGIVVRRKAKQRHRAREKRAGG